VLDPSLGYSEPPLPVGRWLELFVEGPRNAQFISSPGFVPRGFKQMGADIPHSLLPDDESGFYQDPAGDWHLRDWRDFLWSTLSPSPLHHSRIGDSQIPATYQAESARRRYRAKSIESHSAIHEERITGVIRMVSDWNGRTWISLDDHTLWYRLPESAPRPRVGQRLNLTVAADQIIDLH
jgi:hypothetical protein